MPAPTDPFDLAPHTAPRAADLNERFGRLYDALDKTVVGLDAASFADAAFSAKWPTPQVWQTIALTGIVWSPTTLAFYKDALDIVRFKPQAYTTVATLPNDTVIGQLPAGYRPGQRIYEVLWNLPNETAVICQIDFDGTLTFRGGGIVAGGGSAAGTHIFNAAFRAEN